MGDLLGRAVKILLATFVSVLAICTWAIIGLFYWVPLLARASAWFSFALIIAAVNKKPAISAARGLDRAASFYVKGFKSIIETLFALFRSESEVEAQQKGTDDDSLIDVLFSASSLASFFKLTAFAAIAWLLALAFFYYWFGSLDFLTHVLPSGLLK